MLTVINYHYVRENFDSKYPSIFGVTPVSFRKQLLLLKNEGDFVTPNTLLCNLDDILESNENIFFITFDDGLKEQINYALPILEELNLSAMFFVNSRNFKNKIISTVHKIHLLRSILPSSIILEKASKIEALCLSESEKQRAQFIYQYDDKRSAELKYLLNYKMNFDLQELFIDSLFSVYFDEDEILNELYFSNKDLISLASKGHLGSHTHSHYPLGLLDSDVIFKELEMSKIFFEKLTNSVINMVAYPYGTKEACNDEVALLSQKASYKLGFTTQRGTNTKNENKLLLNRFDCNDLIGGKNFK